jgi:hypothetical protein
VILLGRVVRLQIQTASLKLGERPNRTYDPAPLVPVPALQLSPRGASANATEAGDTLFDVHHADHPASKYEAGREVSFGFTSHYGHMRGRYGEHIATGCAGENILLEAEDPDRLYRLEDFSGGLAFVSAATGAAVRLDAVIVADPCVEVSRFSLADPKASPQDIKPVLQFLGDGMRGYCFTPAGDMVLVPGDQLVALRA